MRRRVRMVAWLLAILWMPVTVHCHLEQLLPTFAFLKCSDHGQTAPHRSDDCRQDACDSVESGHYLTPSRQSQIFPPTVSSSLIWSVVLLDSVRAPACVLISEAFRGEHRPASTSCWHFLQRAAPSPRAPSSFI